MEDINIFKNYKYYPLLLTLHNKEVLIIGGGKVAARKLKGFIRAGAKVKIISLDFCKEIKELYKQHRKHITLINRKYKPGDLKGTFLVVAATSDKNCQTEIYKEAKKNNILINIVDEPNLCDFIVPSTIFLEDLVIAISTQGASPAISRLIRKRLESQIIPSYVLLVKLAGSLRNYIKDNIQDEKIRHKILKKIADPRLIEWIEKEKWDKIRSWVKELFNTASITPDKQYIKDLLAQLQKDFKHYN